MILSARLGGGKVGFDVAVQRRLGADELAMSSLWLVGFDQLVKLINILINGLTLERLYAIV